MHTFCLLDAAALSTDTITKLDSAYTLAVVLLGAGVVALVVAIVLLIANRKKK